MQKLIEIVEIDRRFQNSVNLQLDLDRKEIIESYIPTSSCERILNHYFCNIEENREKATILIGPYGKGKSHLLLVLLDKLRHRQRPYLPVLVSGTYKDASKAFLMGMLDALKREGFEELSPDSYYSKAVEMILTWKEEYPDAYGAFVKMIGEYNYTEKEFCIQLCNMNQEALHLFREIYPKITFGSKFLPIVETEPARLYREVSCKLSEEYGYEGMFIVFDEFSKYLKGHERETFAQDMKVIQDMCELAAGSGPSSIHITFVAHKSMKEYGTALEKDMADAFTGVEGRLKEIRFIVSAQNNYELIEQAIHKLEPEYSKIFTEGGGLENYKKNAIESYGLKCFCTLFKEEEYTRLVVKGCFPLMPLTACLLLLASERVAQNERSIFTYLANDERGTLYRHIRDAGEDRGIWPVTADTVYDYFSYLFQEEVSLTRIHEEWLKGEYARSKADTLEEEKVIKVLALLGMVNKTEELPLEEKTIRLALNMTEMACKEVVEGLERKQLIRWNVKTCAYVFIHNVGVDLENEIREAEAKLPTFIDIGKELKRVFESDFILPKLHNQEFTITRFFEYEFMTQEQFSKLTKGEVLFKEHFSDGRIIGILNAGEPIVQLAQSNLQSIADDRVVVLVPSQAWESEKKVRRLLALDRILNDSDFTRQNPVVVQELNSYKEDIIFEINQELLHHYQPSRGNCTVVYQQERYSMGRIPDMSFNGFLSKICTEYYRQGPKVNNELINRQHISPQNKRARKKIIAMILDGGDCGIYERGTSPEATIYRAALLSTGVRGKETKMEPGCYLVLKEIDRFIKSCSGKKRAMVELYEILMGKGYGVRRGILPIYLACQIVKLPDMPVIYLNDREVPMDADVFENIDNCPYEYYLHVEQETVQKEQYLLFLERLFNQNQEKTGKVKKNRLENILVQIQQWQRSLPQIAMNLKKKPEDILEKEFHEICMFRNVFCQMELNPREVLFEEIPQIMDNEDLSVVSRKIQFVRNYLDRYLEEMLDKGAHCLREIIGAGEAESLPASLNAWYKRQGRGAQVSVFSHRGTNFIHYISNIQTYDEKEIVSDISKILLDLYIEDWKDNSLDLFSKLLEQTCREVEKASEDAGFVEGRKHVRFTGSEGEEIERYYDSIKADNVSDFLKNAIEEALDEFGDSLEVNQKVSVLVQTLEQLLCPERR